MQDFFERHTYPPGAADWNFNILFDDQPQVGRMAQEYEKPLQHEAVYSPVPAEWLHMTILRVGYTKDFSDAEMSTVADRLKPKLSDLKMPELTLGSSFYWNSCPALIATPWKSVGAVFTNVMAELEAVVGADRMPSPPDPFVPHMTLAYNRTYNEEQKRELRQQLSDHPVDPVRFRAASVAMIKQVQTPPYYRWDVIEAIPIGQATSVQ